MRLRRDSRAARISFFAATAVLVAVMLLFAWIRYASRPEVLPAAERKVVPALRLNLLTGGTWQLSDHLGEVVAINYWASWCGPCWEETPMLVRLSRELGDRGFAIVGVATDEHTSTEIPPAVHRFVETLHVSYPVAITAPMSQMAYGMGGVPTTILIDRQGRVAQTYVGAVRESRFRADVEALLKEPVQERH